MNNSFYLLSPLMSCFVHPLPIKTLHIAQNFQPLRFNEIFHCFRLKDSIKYKPFCDDFGPMNLSCIARFNPTRGRGDQNFPES